MKGEPGVSLLQPVTCLNKVCCKSCLMLRLILLVEGNKDHFVTFVLKYGTSAPYCMMVSCLPVYEC